MARTPDQILREIIGQLVTQFAVAQAGLEQAQEQLQAQQSDAPKN